MKINQLFVRHVDNDMLHKVLACFNLQGLHDKKLFCRADIIDYHTVDRLNNIHSEISSYYIPCKAKLYLMDMTEKKAITMLKQILRLYGFSLLSREKNNKNKKVIYYQLISDTDPVEPNSMHRKLSHRVLRFNG